MIKNINKHMVKNNNRPNKSYQYSPRHEEILVKMRHPDYEGNFLLPDDSSLLDKTKYRICKQILSYEYDNKLTTEELARRINLSVPETKEVLLCHINKFTLDRLTSYLAHLFPTAELGIISPREVKRVHAKK